MYIARFIDHIFYKQKKAFFIILGIIVCTVYIFLALRAFDFTIDDVFISLRYAKNLVHHGHLEWNNGEIVKTEGYTSLLWVLLCSLFYKLSQWGLFYIAKSLSIFWGIMVLIGSLLLGKRLFYNKVICTLPAILLSVTRPMVLWGVSGKESTMYVFFIVILVYLLVIEEEKGLNFFTPFVLFFISITRTEGIIFYFSIVLTRVFLAIYYKDTKYYFTNRKYLIWNFIFWFCFIIYIVWKLFYYGSIIPSPVYIKRAVGFSGIKYIITFIAYLFPYCLISLIAIIKNIRNKKIYYLVIPFLFYLIAISVVNPIMGFEFRLILAGFPFIYFMSSFELDNILRITKKSVAQKFLIALLLLALFYPLIGNPIVYYRELDVKNSKNSFSMLKKVHVSAGLWLKEYYRFKDDKDNITVALNDAGAIPFYSDLNCINFGGLTDVEFAKKGFLADRVLERRPSFIILKSQDVVNFKGTETRYGKYSDLIYNKEEFKQSYKLRKKFYSEIPFYCLWVFERIEK